MEALSSGAACRTGRAADNDTLNESHTMIAYALAGCIALTAAAQPEKPLQRFAAAEQHMGVLFTIVLYAPDEQTANAGFAAAFGRIAQLNDRLSDYDSASELSRLAQQSPTASPVPVSDDLWAMLRRADEVSRETGGAFDATVGPLSRLWRRARRQRELPDAERLAEARRAVGYRHVRLLEDQQAVELLRPGMRLDLGGIAKGYAADEALRLLRERGLSRALVNASGDIALGDPPPGEPGWKVGVAPLQPEAPPSRILLLANCGVATSGDAFQFVEIEGCRYSHIIDPRTGMALTERSSVTIIAPDCTTADAYASAVSVLGPKEGIRLVERTPGMSALVVVASEDGAGAVTCESSRMKCIPVQPAAAPSQ